MSHYSVSVGCHTDNQADRVTSSVNVSKEKQLKTSNLIPIGIRQHTRVSPLANISSILSSVISDSLEAQTCLAPC